MRSSARCVNGQNFYLAAATGVAGVIDRSEGLDGQLLHVGTPFTFQWFYYGASYGAREINGDLYDGGRRVEIIFELYMLSPDRIPWGACNPLPSLRYLLCEGLGTDLLHIVVGTGPFDTGLREPQLGFVALGDSYSSGTGAPPYLGFMNSPECRRSDQTYSYLIAGMRTPERLTIGNPPTLRACQGAVINDMYNAHRAGSTRYRSSTGWTGRAPAW